MGGIISRVSSDGGRRSIKDMNRDRTETGSPPATKRPRYSTNEKKEIVVDSVITSESSDTHILKSIHDQQVRDLMLRCTELEADKSELQNRLAAKTEEYNRLIVEISITQTNIFDLPVNCLLKIFEFVNDVKLIAETCESWKEIIRKHRKSFISEKWSVFTMEIENSKDGSEVRLWTRTTLHATELRFDDFELKVVPELLEFDYSLFPKKFEVEVTSSRPKNWFDENWTRKPMKLVITNSPFDYQQSIVDPMKSAINMCDDWWLHYIKELHLNYCRITEDWLWIVEKLPNLEIFMMFMPRNKLDMNQTLPISFSSLIAALGNNIHTILMSTFKYDVTEANIVQELIKKSHQTSKGLKMFAFDSFIRSGTKWEISNSCKTLPLNDIIKLIEEAKFDADIHLSFTHDGENHNELYDWMKMNNLLEDGVEQKILDRNRYNFHYRCSKFTLDIFNKK